VTEQALEHEDVVRSDTAQQDFPQLRLLPLRQALRQGRQLLGVAPISRMPDGA